MYRPKRYTDEDNSPNSLTDKRHIFDSIAELSGFIEYTLDKWD